MATRDESFFQDKILIGRTADGRDIAFNGEGVFAIEIDVEQVWFRCGDGHQADSILWNLREAT